MNVTDLKNVLEQAPDHHVVLVCDAAAEVVIMTPDKYLTLDDSTVIKDCPDGVILYGVNDAALAHAETP